MCLGRVVTPVPEQDQDFLFPVISCLRKKRLQAFSWDTPAGNFELYPTQNMYQFLLLDKVTGRTWHVQWGFEEKERWIQRIW